jgi:hypothetical protein
LQTAPGTQEKLHYCVNYWVLNVSFSTDCSILGGQRKTNSGDVRAERALRDRTGSVFLISIPLRTPPLPALPLCFFSFSIPCL